MTETALDLLWLAPALPLLGFVLNGALALWKPTAKTAPSVRSTCSVSATCAPTRDTPATSRT